MSRRLLTPLLLGTRLAPRTRLPARLLPPLVPRRHNTRPTTSPKIYDFAGVKELSSRPSPDRLLVDVREPMEFQAGHIPGAINLPIGSSPDALVLADEDFEDRFGFAKPQKDQELVFYCKAGIRSSAAANVARGEGYENVGEYRGSWMDWERNTKGVA